ncbi:PhzF family phenazine biosynthesis protein [Stackebrandtia nassauensis]|uniref:Phenazine biosynthesis protein PhzF family n=1 Tax=Stackebrandtia nassauensis (strain DSM 44728 / CIP 108903 / NRRL B-16338 / NBRC 102104 / LLR-40K-21) TaxID=446470 RepID=D3Q3Q2_STANL|nr:PhzF family phenazine biosynthesis protein [Stackebrandtia nassauensis]ADD43969.1 phenazine biosynthesis protein PhzF family [Stackebrandtia nassauensis DSM 44728]
MAGSRDFAQVDVFGQAPYLGNPVAVVLDGDGVEDEVMRRIANWTNLSETTFVLSPNDPEADYRLRIFTPGLELEFAGHPTLGSAHAWLENGGKPKRAGRIVQECAAGLVELRQGEGGLSFAAPPRRRVGELEAEHLAAIVDAFGIEREAVVSHQWVDNGPGWAVIRLGSAEEVLALEPDFSRFPTAMVGAVGEYPKGSEFAYELRTFAPASGVFEDPVCGSMNASVAQWLTGAGEMPAAYKVSQGARLGRRGEVAIAVEEDGTVWVGGATTTCFRGTAIA